MYTARTLAALAPAGVIVLIGVSFSKDALNLATVHDKTRVAQSTPPDSPPGEGDGSRRDGPFVHGDADSSNAARSLPFKVRKGYRFAFETSLPVHTSTVKAASLPAPTALPRSYSIIVQDVSESQITLSLKIEGPGARKDKASKQPTATQASESPAAEATPGNVTLGPNGRLRATENRIPPGAESHLRFVFGSGLHLETLRPGSLYDLAPLYETETSASIATRLRYEGASRHGDTELARFSVVRRDDGTSAAHSTSPDTPVDGPDAAGTTGSLQQPSEWKSIGEAVYRVDDGFLEKVTLNRVASKSGGGSVGGVAIVRVRTIP